MNASSLADLREGRPAAVIDRQPEDDRLEQVRELLYGERRRVDEARMTRLEERLGTLEHTLGERIDALQARVDALAAAEVGARRRALEEIASGLSALGEKVHRSARG